MTRILQGEIYKDCYKHFLAKFQTADEDGKGMLIGDTFKTVLADMEGEYGMSFMTERYIGQYLFDAVVGVRPVQPCSVKLVLRLGHGAGLWSSSTPQRLALKTRRRIPDCLRLKAREKTSFTKIFSARSLNPREILSSEAENGLAAVMW